MFDIVALEKSPICASKELSRNVKTQFKAKYIVVIIIIVILYANEISI